MNETTRPADPLLAEAIARGAAAVRNTSAVMISDHEAHRLAAVAIGAAEPPLRRHLALDIAASLESRGITPAVAQVCVVLRELARDE